MVLRLVHQPDGINEELRLTHISHGFYYDKMPILDANGFQVMTIDELANSSASGQIDVDVAQLSLVAAVLRAQAVSYFRASLS